MATAKKPVKKAAKKKSARKVKPKTKPVVVDETKPVDGMTAEEIAEEQDHKRRMDWDGNHVVISEAFFSLVLKTKKMPTYKQIADQAGLSTKTIQRHFDDPQILTAGSAKLRALRDNVMMAVAIKAMTGKSVWWAKLFLEATEGELITKKIDVQSGGQPINNANRHSLTDDQFAELLKNLNAKTAAH